MTISENIELPKLTADEAWLDESDTDLGLSEAVKRLLYLPFIAYKTVLYNNSNELSEYQKDRLKLLFRDEAEQAFNEVHNQVLLMVGNAPTDRLEYFKDFESWKERLVELVKKSLDCITKEQFLKEIKEITNTLPSKEQLAIEGKLTTKGTVTVEGKNQIARILEYLTKRGKEKVFVEHIYWNIFSKFIIEASQLIRRSSVMSNITMERTDWIIQGLKNIGKLPENVKIDLKKNRISSQNSAKPQTQGKARQGNIETTKKSGIAKEPSKEAQQAYQLYFGSDLTQTKVAEKMTKTLKKPVSQGQVSKWIKQYKKWREAEGIPVDENKPNIITNSNILDMGVRTDGKITGDPLHKKNIDYEDNE